MCKISQGIQIFDKNFHVLWFLIYGPKYVKTKVFDIFPVPEKTWKWHKMKVTMIILGISSIILANIYMPGFLNILVQTQLGHYPYHPTLISLPHILQHHRWNSKKYIYIHLSVECIMLALNVDILSFTYSPYLAPTSLTWVKLTKNDSDPSGMSSGRIGMKMEASSTPVSNTRSVIQQVITLKSHKFILSQINQWLEWKQ